MSCIMSPPRMFVQTSVTGAMAARLDELATYYQLAPSRFNGVLAEQVLAAPALSGAWQAVLDAEPARVKLIDRVNARGSMLDEAYEALRAVSVTLGRERAAVMRALLTAGIANMNGIPGLWDALGDAWLEGRATKAVTVRGAA
ncbi:hypothetical protein SAMN05216466_106194 [Paraburkholderia phenazinium]|uniref:Uncharacterized protein n=1 Tax=Paraburkholderia phenazinium TaxID=60549 RepID=A0A1G7YHL0_9BURK|nr:hypothetical protein [Paraburkholderia phenazinium]SDG96041.1 hypothetical protein SAMN05216466_106194 [Paraburkholderia phenazinium]